MGKILAIYFTGTGNSKKVLDLATCNFKEKGFEVDIINVCGGDIKDINNYDYLIISYPIYAFNAPKPIIDYVKKIGKAEKDIKCLILKNSGEHLFWNNSSSLQIFRMLRRRNIKFISEYHYLMPYSFMFRHTDYMAYRMWRTVQSNLPLDINDFLNGDAHRYKRFFLDDVFTFIFRIQRFGGRFNGIFYKVSQDKCSKCGKCVNNCPAKNISLKEGKIKFGNKCLMCQKCAMYCPSQAISVGLFKRWAVGGAYSFKEQLTYEQELKPKFCVKNYKKYFEYCEKRRNGEDE